MKEWFLFFWQTPDLFWLSVTCLGFLNLTWIAPLLAGWGLRHYLPEWNEAQSETLGISFDQFVHRWMNHALLSSVAAMGLWFLLVQGYFLSAIQDTLQKKAGLHFEKLWGQEPFGLVSQGNLKTDFSVRPVDDEPAVDLLLKASQSKQWMVEAPALRLVVPEQWSEGEVASAIGEKQWHQSAKIKGEVTFIHRTTVQWVRGILNSRAMLFFRVWPALFAAFALFVSWFSGMLALTGVTGCFLAEWYLLRRQKEGRVSEVVLLKPGFSFLFRWRGHRSKFWSYLFQDKATGARFTSYVGVKLAQSAMSGRDTRFVSIVRLSKAQIIAAFIGIGPLTLIFFLIGGWSVGKLGLDPFLMAPFLIFPTAVLINAFTLSFLRSVRVSSHGVERRKLRLVR